MEYRRLGASGLQVSKLCLGAMMFGERTDAATAARIVRSAFDAGVNFIDTADTYDQWREYLAALNFGFDAEDEALVERMVPCGHSSTPGYTDPKHPVTGRLPRE